VGPRAGLDTEDVNMHLLAFSEGIRTPSSSLASNGVYLFVTCFSSSKLSS
jgi:hypothetical protein